MLLKRLSHVYYSLFVALFVFACGDSGGGEPPEVIGGGTVTEIGEQGPPVLPPVSVEPPAAFNGNFTLTIVDETDEDVINAIGSVLQPGVSFVNSIAALPQDIPVAVQDCGVANAFYLPPIIDSEISGPAVFMCWELLDQMFSQFFAMVPDDSDFAVISGLSAYSHVMYHEIGHALEDQLNLPIVGNTESAADAIAAVLSIEQGDGFNVIAAALLFDLSADGSFAGVHPAGADRAGDLFCWALGGDSELADAFTDLAQIFIDSGRDCVSEYAGQLESVSSWLPGVARTFAASNDRSIAAAKALPDYALDSLQAAVAESATVVRLKADNK